MPDRNVRVKLSLSASDFNRGLTAAGRHASAFSKNLDDVDNRMSGIVQTGLALGPALVPATAAAAGAAATLANSLGFAAVGAGTAALAFTGVGDALGAVNDYQLEPSTENLEKMRQALHELGPAGRDFVMFLQNLRPELDQLQNAARAGLFPGVEAGIRDMMDLLPVFENIVANVGAAMGGLAEDAGKALSGPFWTEFFTFIATDAASALDTMGRSIGNVVEGFAGMMMAFDPVSDDLGTALLRMSEDFAQWGRDIGNTQGFRDFTDYMRDAGPKLVDTFAALGEAFIQVAEAAAPIGTATLGIIEGLARAIGAIASIPVVGPALIGAAAGMAAVSRAVSLYKASGMASFVTGLRGIDAEGKKASAAMTGLARAGAALAGVAVAVSVIENIGRALSDTLPGLNEMQNRLVDISTGAAADLGPQFDGLAEAIENVAQPKWHDNVLEAVGLPPSREMRESQEQVTAIDTALAELARTEGPAAAQRHFREMAESEKLTRRETQWLLQNMPAYQEVLEGAGLDAKLAGEGMDFFAASGRRAERAMRDLNGELMDLQKTLERRATLRDYQAALDEINKAIKENGRSLDINTPRGRANQEVLDGIAEASLGVAEHMRGINKMRFMQQARSDFVDAAQKFGLTAGEARNLADRLGLVQQRGHINILLRETGMDRTTQKLRETKEAADRIPERIDTRVEGDTRDADRDLGVTAGKLQDIDRTTAVPGIKVDKNQAERDTNAFVNFFSGRLKGIDNEEVKVELTGLAKLALTGQGPLSEFAAGGRVPIWGRPHEDSVLAALTPNEHVATEPEVRAAGGGNVERGHRVWENIRRAALMGALPDPMDLPRRFADGGAVMGVGHRGFPAAIRSIEDAFSGVAARIGDQLSARINEMYRYGGGRPLGPGGSLSQGQMMMGQRFAQSQVGKPYIWGGVGPGGYDCSGFQSAIYNSAVGRSPYSRIGSTGTMPWPGMQMGTGGYTIGWFTGSPGHMSGNIGGLNVESSGGVGAHVGSGARSPLDAMFNARAHYDSGGPLHPGWTMAYNGTGADEYVVRGYQDGGKVDWREEALAPVERRFGERSAITTAIRDWLEGIKRKQYSEEKLQARLEHVVDRSFNPLLRGFDVSKPGMGVDDVRSELAELRSGLKEALGRDAPILKTLDRLDGRILDDTRDRAKLTRTSEKLSDRIESLRESRDELARTVAGNFRNDIFAGGLEDLSLQLRADTNDARRMRRGLATAERKGLSGGLYRQLAESGNFLLAQQFANLSRAQIRRYERMFASRSQVSGGLGRMVGREVYGPEIRENSRELRQNNKALNRQTRELRRHGRKLERSVERSSARKRARTG